MNIWLGSFFFSLECVFIRRSSNLYNAMNVFLIFILGSFFCTCVIIIIITYTLLMTVDTKNETKRNKMKTTYRFSHVAAIMTLWFCCLWIDFSFSLFVCMHICVYVSPWKFCEYRTWKTMFQAQTRDSRTHTYSVCMRRILLCCATYYHHSRQHLHFDYITFRCFIHLLSQTILSTWNTLPHSFTSSFIHLQYILYIYLGVYLVQWALYMSLCWWVKAIVLCILLYGVLNAFVMCCGCIAHKQTHEQREQREQPERHNFASNFV